ncbi:MAG: serine/threonine protein kinase [Xanthomonadales bacterium]|nr:serine/threonine protein kinase [Xanthomonadales bacterium]
MVSPVSERFRRLEPLLDRALELDEVARARFVEICAEIHPDLARDLRRALDPEAQLPELGSLAAEVTRTPSLERQGLRIGAWQLLDKIGQGGMGTVYRAERADGAFEKQVAIKLLHRADAPFREALARERAVLARLEHPGIVRLIDGGVLEDDMPWLAMELAEGESLDVWLRKENPDIKRRLDVFLAICDAVAHAHGGKLVHRDLKPSNIRVTDSGTVKLLDFGVARLLSPDAHDTITRQWAVTPEYAAPEQLMSGAASARTDIYALGALLYLLLVGRSIHPPFDGNWVEYLQQIKQCDATPASHGASAGGLSMPPTTLRGDLDAIIIKAMAHKPEDRYARVEDVVEDIRRHRNHQCVQARSRSWRYRLDKWMLRKRALLLIIAGVLAAMTLGAVGMAWLNAR